MILIHLITLSMFIAAEPLSFPVFLRPGFSSILEFEEAPTQVVVGDQNSFQVERLNKSIVLKPLVTNATTNMFVYFKSQEARIFILKATEDAEPTYFKKFTTIAPSTLISPNLTKFNYKRGVYLKKVNFNNKRDYLTIDFIISADASEKILVDWDNCRLKYKNTFQKPIKVWAERREVQRDSKINARFVFTKPNLPRKSLGAFIILPLINSKNSLTFEIKGAYL